jgi:cobalamin biosynthesis protein CbiG
MNKEYELQLEFHENGRLKSIKNKTIADYGSIDGNLTEPLIEKIIKIINENTKIPTIEEIKDKQ